MGLGFLTERRNHRLAVASGASLLLRCLRGFVNLSFVLRLLSPRVSARTPEPGCLACRVLYESELSHVRTARCLLSSSFSPLHEAGLPDKMDQGSAFAG